MKLAGHAPATVAGGARKKSAHHPKNSGSNTPPTLEEELAKDLVDTSTFVTTHVQNRNQMETKHKVGRVPKIDTRKMSGQFNQPRRHTHTQYNSRPGAN
eukprot:Nk52_evm35s2309 gene=Nk52_evmTU35s2309